MDSLRFVCSGSKERLVLYNFQNHFSNCPSKGRVAVRLHVNSIHAGSTCHPGGIQLGQPILLCHALCISRKLR